VCEVEERTVAGQLFQRLVDQLTGRREVPTCLGQPRPEARLFRPAQLGTDVLVVTQLAGKVDHLGQGCLAADGIRRCQRRPRLGQSHQAAVRAGRTSMP
jgi:hypothetical protein